ncbi:AMP-binding protein [Ereboglobus luteus]|uniref:AMP-dependent synthetase n=1 Tax=Ereboglobus luteus TaxID=1796921 RepID=A0A2U8E5W8_9BACT|nr:AMP-binding protein [Ereboglobus luteus]AWI09922.1 AMP-dependent synthetase [Ereboglobus luteus]
MATKLFRKRSYLPLPLEWLLLPIVRLMYRVKTRRPENVPERGGVILIANHLSFVDAIVLQLACPRPLRFLGYEGLKANVFFEKLFRWSGMIGFSPRDPVGSTRRVLRSLQDGEVLCIFGEGHISRIGELMRIKNGFEAIAKRAGVPVVPVAHDGLWGSVFSFSGDRWIFKSPRIMPTHVCVCFGRPMLPSEATAEKMRRELLDLGAEAFSARPVLRRHLGAEAARALVKHPSFIQVIDRTGDRAELSAAKLFAVAAALSRRLKKTVPEKRVGIVLPPGAGAYIANLAVSFANKIPVNLNFTAGKTTSEACMKLGEISTVISAPAMQERVPNFPWPAGTKDLKAEIMAISKVRILFWIVVAYIVPNQLVPRLLGLPRRGDNDECSLLFTSGTSGEPKGVVYTHRNILAQCWQISSIAVLPASARMLACLPLFHSFGYSITVWYMILRGCTTITVPSPLDTRRVVDSIRDEKATVIIGVPSFLRPILKRATHGELKSLELVVSGAEKMPMDLYDSFMNQFHIDIMEGFGLTETSPVTNVNQQHPPSISRFSVPQYGKRLGSVGRLLPGMSARILDPDTHEDLPLTSTGLLLFKGDNVFTGYLKDAAKTAEALRDGWFFTGDLARFDEDGFLFIEGRLSRFSKLAGEMVPHGTIEETIVKTFGFGEEEGYVVAVTGVPDEAKGEILVLLSTRDIELADLRQKLTDAGLPNLWVPRIILKVDQIPVLGSGKLDLKALKEAATSGIHRHGHGAL